MVEGGKVWGLKGVIMNRYKVIYNKNGTCIEVEAHGYIIKDNTLIFEIYDEYFVEVATFNMNNIIGFYKLGYCKEVK